MIRPKHWLTFAAAAFMLVVAAATPHALPTFTPHEIATGLRGGYQVVVTDLNKDGRPDVIAVASNLTELVWFENPGWQRHVLASGISGPINAAAADLDGDGIPEVALAHGFATTPARSTGVVTLLTHGSDPEQPWTAREIDRVPTAHRLRWYQPPGQTERWLVNAPLLGEKAVAAEDHNPTPILVYRPPEWKRETLPVQQEGVLHAVEPIDFGSAAGTPPAGASPSRGAESSSLLVASFLGVSQYRWSRDAWSHQMIFPGNPEAWPKSGASEIAQGRLGQDRFLATIEPWHGNKVVVYEETTLVGIGGGGSFTGWGREEIDTTLTDGHTLVLADLDGDGRDEIIAGERGGQRAVRIYANTGRAWTRTLLDEGQMGAAGCAVADLNADRRVDLVCIATTSANLKWYENKGP